MAVVFMAFIGIVVWEMRRVFQVPGPVAPGLMVFRLEELLLCVSMAGLVGLTFGFKIGHCFQMAAEMFWGDRQTELLIRYHDILNEHNLLSQTTSTHHDSTEHTT